MDKPILYFLGAGASIGALPLAKDFSEDLRQSANALRYAGPKGDQYPEPTSNPEDPIWGKPRDNFVEALWWLAEESSHHFSVDTFAKKLFFRGDRNNLKKLKAALSAYLVAKQSLNHVDRRYDSFLASVLAFDKNRNIKLPENLQILTWNYDFQWEKALYGFCQDANMVCDSVAFNQQFIRINGRCGTNPPGHVNTSFWGISSPDGDKAWEAGITLYDGYMSASYGIEPEIRFAWEEETNNRLINTALKEEISAIVVIGYSFPYFNREIDDYIFKKFRRVERLYLQYPEGVHSSIEERIKKLIPPNTKIVRITFTDLFFIPDEFGH